MSAPCHGRRREHAGEPRARKHVRLQAQAKRYRNRVYMVGALAAFVAPRIPLAGCLTPRALADRRARKVPGFEARS